MNWYVGAYLGVDSSDAQTLYLAFNSFTYIMPMISGIVSDTFLGAQRTLYYSAIIYIAGLLVILVSTVINQELEVAGGIAQAPNTAGTALYAFTLSLY